MFQSQLQTFSQARRRGQNSCLPTLFKSRRALADLCAGSSTEEPRSPGRRFAVAGSTPVLRRFTDPASRIPLARVANGGQAPASTKQRGTLSTERVDPLSPRCFNFRAARKNKNQFLSISATGGAFWSERR